MSPIDWMSGRHVRSGGMLRGSNQFAHGVNPVVRPAYGPLLVRPDATLGYGTRQRANCRKAPGDAFFVSDLAPNLFGFMPANCGLPGSERRQDRFGSWMPTVTKAAQRVNHPLRVDHADFGKVRFVFRDGVGAVAGIEGEGGYLTLNRLVRWGFTIAPAPALGGSCTTLLHAAEHQAYRTAVPDRSGVLCGPRGVSSDAGDSSTPVNGFRTVAKVATG